MKFFILGVFLLACISCKEEVQIKPKAMLHLDYPEQVYKNIQLDCAFSLDVNLLANVIRRENCRFNIEYPKMKAVLHLTYLPINNNLDSLLFDAQKLTYDHTSRASRIDDYAYEDTINQVYGQYFELGGSAATLSQFYVTDTLHHFLNGSLYFKVKPNYDSLYPAADYLRKDIKRIIESIEWNNYEK